MWSKIIVCCWTHFNLSFSFTFKGCDLTRSYLNKATLTGFMIIVKLQTWCSWHFILWWGKNLRLSQFEVQEVIGWQKQGTHTSPHTCGHLVLAPASREQLWWIPSITIQVSLQAGLFHPTRQQKFLLKYLRGSLLIVPEFATFNSPWAVTRPRQSATSVLTKLSSLLLLYSCSTIHPSSKTVSVLSPSSLNGSPRIVVEVFITLPIDWQEIVGDGWFGHPSVLRLLAMWWAICCFLEVKDYHITTSFSSCPQGNKHMEAHKVVTK